MALFVPPFCIVAQLNQNIPSSFLSLFFHRHGMAAGTVPFRPDERKFDHLVTHSGGECTRVWVVQEVVY